jgi:hypothetical protein
MIVSATVAVRDRDARRPKAAPLKSNTGRPSVARHAVETPSSGCAAPTLRFGAFSVTASRRRGKWHPYLLVRDAAKRPRSLTKRIWRQTAVDARSGQGRRSRPRSGGLP